jgi:hypothetical protein
MNLETIRNYNYIVTFEQKRFIILEAKGRYFQIVHIVFKAQKLL